jgi:cytochrome c-type biogenesis protein CcmH/NrfG
MSQSRIEIFEQMLVGDPANTAVLFGLAKEYEKAGDETKLIETLERYLRPMTKVMPTGCWRGHTNDQSKRRRRERLINVALMWLRRMVIRAWLRSIEKS